MIGKYKVLIIITLIGVFALGVAAGYFGERYLMHVRYERLRASRPRFPSLDAMAKEVGMNAEQRDRIGEIFRKNEERLKGLRGLMQDKIKEIRAQLKSEIDAVLTAEQQKKFETMIEKYFHPPGGERDRRAPSGRDVGHEPRRDPGRAPEKDPGREPKGDLK